jgi:hypothetical protein
MNPYIAVGIPHKQEVTVKWVERMLLPLHQFNPQMRKTLIFNGNYPIDLARNQIAEGILSEPSFTHLLFVDSDNITTSPPDVNEAISRLLKHDIPIVCGLYRLKTPNYPFSIAFSPDAANDRLFEITGCGMGFCLIKREVFEKVPRPWFEYKDDGVELVGEDVYFCEKARASGYKVFADPTILLSHIGTFALNFNGTFDYIVRHGAKAQQPQDVSVMKLTKDGFQ